MPDINDAGQLLGYVGTVIDISRRIEAEESLRHQSAQLEAANANLAQAARLKDQFLANMSHELRTPLTGVIGFSEAMSQGIYGSLSAAQQTAARHIFDNGQHLLSLINDILDLARIGAGQIDLKLGPVSVDDVCAEVIDLIGPMAAGKTQRFSYAHPPVGLIINADVLRLRQILINLLSNAVKFTPESGEFGLAVEIDDAAGEVRFVVWDRGIGIAPAHQPLLFQPFVQLDNRLSRTQPGTGLGLALVRQLAVLHGGSVKLRSALGEGSTFTVSLPQRQHHDAYELPARQVALSLPSEGQALILLAEDDPSVSALLRDYLGTQGYALVHIDHGDSVLALLRNIRPQLALIDIQLPGTSGLEIIARLRADLDQQLARTPVIAVTALAMVGDRERCFAAGADDYLSKPIRLDELGAAVARALNEQRKTSP
jgi:signal transduction histidine kinase/CheY-like chemotaxis protein